MLKAHGVGPMFGMGGFQLLPFYGALEGLGLTHHLINDERCAAMACDAYARVTGRPGVCDATLGPGATNLVTGLVESLNAGLPQVVLVGDANRAHAHKNMTQEANQVEILRPAVKELIRIEDGNRIPELVRRAFGIATSGRPGPVVLDVPEDVCHGTFDYEAADFAVDPATLAIPARRIRPDGSGSSPAPRASSRRPAAAHPGRRRGASVGRLRRAPGPFAQDHNIPVAHTMSGKGALGCSHPLSAGLFGRYSRIANELIEASDCLIAVGCKLGEIATKRYSLIPAATPLIHIDIEAAELGRWRQPEVALWADARAALDDLAAELVEDGERGRVARADTAAEVPARMAKWRGEAAGRLEASFPAVRVHASRSHYCPGSARGA